MFVCGFGCSCLLCVLGILAVIADRDINKCVSKEAVNSIVIKPQFCLTTNKGVELMCPKDKIVVVSGLQIAMKSSSGVCMQRIPGPRSAFCCYVQRSDVLFDAQCMQELWNSEDRNHYQLFLKQSLAKCDNASQCVLNSRMFANLQKEIPTLGGYSSYFHVLYQCIPAPVNPMNWCTATSTRGKNVHFMNSLNTGSNANKTCTCRVTSQSNANIIVRAVDIRLNHSQLILSSNEKVKNVQSGSRALFGLMEIFSAKRLNMSLRLGSSKLQDHIWVQLSGSNGKDVFVTCGETIPVVEKKSPVPVHATSVTRETVFLGYWPLIYIASGALSTFLIVACVLSSLLICRRGKRRRHHHHTCGHPSHPSPADFHQDPYDHPYATVMDDNPPHPPDAQLTSPPFNQTPERLYGKTYMRTTSLRNLYPPTTSAPLPPTASGGLVSDSPSSSYPRLSMARGVENNVSQLEAFLKC